MRQSFALLVCTATLLVAAKNPCKDACVEACSGESCKEACSGDPCKDKCVGACSGDTPHNWFSKKCFAKCIAEDCPNPEDCPIPAAVASPNNGTLEMDAKRTQKKLRGAAFIANNDTLTSHEVAEDPCAPGAPNRCSPLSACGGSAGPLSNCSPECRWYGKEGCNNDCTCHSTPLLVSLELSDEMGWPWCSPLGKECDANRHHCCDDLVCMAHEVSPTHDDYRCAKKCSLPGVACVVGGEPCCEGFSCSVEPPYPGRMCLLTCSPVGGVCWGEDSDCCKGLTCVTQGKYRSCIQL